MTGSLLPDRLLPAATRVNANHYCARVSEKFHSWTQKVVLTDQT